MKAEIGVIGLGVMGKSLSRNLAQKGFSVSLFNRHLKGKEESVALDFKQAFPELKNSQAFDNLQSFVASLESPKKIIVMIAAGTAMDELLSQITPLLSVDDIIVDGGNSHFEDTQKRIKLLQKKRDAFYRSWDFWGGIWSASWTFDYAFWKCFSLQ